MHRTSFAQEVSTFLDLPLSEASCLEEQEELYAIAYLHYEKGSYAHAAEFFTKLVLCDPFSEKYWKGLASSKQMQNEYRAALQAWTSCALLDEKDPLVHFHAAECLFSLNEKEDALKALHAADSLIAQSEKDHPLRNKIEVLKGVHGDV